MSYSKRLIFVLILAVLLIASCSSPSPTLQSSTPVPSPAATTGTSSTYPGANQNPAYPGPGQNAAYPGPGGAPPTTVPWDTGPAPTSSSGGTVTGRILVGSNLAPLNNYPLYLGEVLHISGGTPALATIDRAHSPQAHLSQDGTFTFVNVPPGKYSLVIDIIEKTFVLKNPSDGKDLLIQVEEGKTEDLGTLKYPDLQLNQ